MLENLLSFSLAVIVLAISPGPDNIYVLTQSVIHGAKSGVATVAGLMSGCIVHTTLLAFGVSALMTASPAIFYGLKILGALYLLYLAFKVYRSDSEITLSNDGASAAKKSYFQLYKIGVVMNLVNPKVMIFFLAFFPGFLWNESGNTVFQFYTLGLVFIIVSFLVFSTIAVLSGKLSVYIVQHKNVGLYLKWLQIVVFIGIAVYILLPEKS